MVFSQHGAHLFAGLRRSDRRRGLVLVAIFFDAFTCTFRLPSRARRLEARWAPPGVREGRRRSATRRAAQPPRAAPASTAAPAPCTARRDPTCAVALPPVGAVPQCTTTVASRSCVALTCAVPGRGTRTPSSAALRGPHGRGRRELDSLLRGGAHERPELVHDVEPAGEGRHARDAGARVRLQHLAGPRIGNAVMENAPKANGHC